MDEINDIRSSAEFKGITFSKFKKSQVKKELINALLAEKVEPACYWSAELICAGHFKDMWDCIISYMGKYIHIGNPKLPIYLNLRFNNFKEIIENGYIQDELSLRNNLKIRQIFAEIILVLCFSIKKHSFETIKLNKDEDFNMTFMASKLKATSIDFGQNSFEKDDPKEIYIAVNEFAYNITDKRKNSVIACYWYEWLLEYENLCKKRKEKCEAERRTFAPIHDKYQKDIIWILWDILFKELDKQNNPIKNKIMQSLLSLFCLKYSSSSKKKFRYIFYYAVTLVVENYKLDIDIINDKNSIENIIKRINFVYKDIIKNQISPDTDYLFTGLDKKSNLEKTRERLEKMNQIINKT